MKIAFFHLPRTGGTFIVNYIKLYLHPYYVHMQHHTPYIYVNPQKLKNAYKVVFIRNPFDWYVSHYFYFARKDQKQERGLLLGWDDQKYGRRFLKKFPTFEVWLQWAYNTLPNFSMEKCFKTLCCNEDEWMAMDFVGKIENRYEDFNKILAACNIRSPRISMRKFYKIQHDNKYINASKHGDYKQYHTPKTIALIEKHEQFILKTYNYEY